MTLQERCAKLAESKPFDIFITIIILINSFLIGVQTTVHDTGIDFIQSCILIIFTFEITVRYIAAGSAREFFKGGWNNFDLILVLIGWIPTSIAGDGHAMMALRVLRVFRVLRLLRTAKEIKLIVGVLIKSMKSMLYNAILFLIFIYLFAVAGVSMFRMPNPDTLSEADRVKYEQLMEHAPNSPTNSPDPYGSIGEAFFTLFRALTGEDWTDLRYNLVSASEAGIINISPTVITVYHVSWFCIAALLLLNLVTGAVINNYMMSIEEEHDHKAKPQIEA